MSPTLARTRGVARLALMPAAAFAVHQLRYLLAFGGHAGAVLAQQGHAYLNSAVPWLVISIALAVGAFLWSLGRALAGQRTAHRYAVSLVALWALCALLLIGIYVLQECLEGLFATGHPGGWIGIFGYGGWWSIPAALCVGLVLATIFHGARWVLDEVADRRRRAAPRRTVQALPVARPHEHLLIGLAPLVGGWSGRGPPSR